MSANFSTVRLSDDREICLSYGVPVAAFLPGRGYVKTARKYSTTSSRRANSFAGDRAKIVDDATFCELIAPIASKR